MIRGIHLLLYTTNPDADRAFLRDTLNLRAVDAGGGWLIFALPPAEIAVHPSDTNLVLAIAPDPGEPGQGGSAQAEKQPAMLGAQTFFITDDVDAAVRTLASRGVACDPVRDAPWGRFTAFALPSGGRLGLYQPMHPLAIDMINAA
jgi:catechol 2,3-dioxygenase-like lactoylglutathione lyase family enzyme